jgi:hypothetical protein
MANTNNTNNKGDCEHGLSCFLKNCDLKHEFIEQACKGCERCYKGVFGSGVLFVSNDFIVLGQEASGRNVGLFDVLGGSCDGKTDIDTAITEVYEESATFYSVTNEQIKNAYHVDIVGGRHLFRTWVVVDPKIKCTTFNSVMRNTKSRNEHLNNIIQKISSYNDITQMKKKISSYNEITQMRKFHINLIENGGIVGETLQVHGTGEHLPISDRAKKILQTAVRMKIFEKINSFNKF